MCHQYRQSVLVQIIALVTLTMQATGAIAADRLYVKPDGSDARSGRNQDQLRTQTIDAKGHSTAHTLNGVLPRGRWNHLVITVDRRHEAQRVYVNGRDVTSTDHLGHRDWPARGPIWLGRFSDREQSRRLDLDERLGDVRIYRGHLRQAAIRALSRRRPAR